MLEIERKFLVKTEAYKESYFKKTIIAQGYLNSSPERTVRIRIKGDKGYITIKGKSSANGLSRFEWEKEIDLSEANQLMLLCETGVIEKTRYEVIVGKHTFEIDEFYGENKGLIIAEIELSAENEIFEFPDWLGEEVTGNEKYYNSYISKNPYKNWI